jgi:hypothetical protein
LHRHTDTQSEEREQSFSYELMKSSTWQHQTSNINQGLRNKGARYSGHTYTRDIQNTITQQLTRCPPGTPSSVT